MPQLRGHEWGTRHFLKGNAGLLVREILSAVEATEVDSVLAPLMLISFQTTRHAEHHKA
jgi:predicted benzoate:H+ symporter BenE